MNYYLVKTEADFLFNQEPCVELRVVTQEEYEQLTNEKYQKLCMGDIADYAGIATIGDYISETTFTPITEEQYELLKKLGIEQFGSKMCEEALDSIEKDDDKRSNNDDDEDDDEE